MACKTKYSCPDCGQHLLYPGALARHKAKHVPPGGFLCSICEAPFTSVEARQMHKREMHIVYRCLECRDKFSVEQEYHDHVEKMHAGNMKKPKEICDTCGSQFPTKTQLRYHVESNCGTEKRFRCEICSRSYLTNASLKIHKRSHQIGKTELCGFCGASFLNRGQLKIHERVHTGEKPYKCDKCDKAFSYRESLITHSTIHTGIKPFFCQCCDARFSCVGNLIKHRKLRPTTCGLAKYNPTNRVAARPTKKTMPSLTDRKKFHDVRHTLVDSETKPTKIASETRTVSLGLARENKSGESARGTNNFLQDGDEAVLNEEDYDSENEVEEGQLIDVIFEEKSNDQTSDSELASSNDCTSNNDTWHSGTKGTTAQEIDAKEKSLSFNIEIVRQESETHCSQDNEADDEKQQDMSIADEPRKHVEILRIQFVQEGEQADDEKSESNEPTSPDILNTTDGLAGHDHLPVITVNDVVNLERDSKSEQKDSSSPSYLSKAVCVKPESTTLQESPEISTEELNTLAIEKEEQELQAQLEILRANSVDFTNMFACKLCPLQYTTAYLMARHLERIHSFQLERAREKLKFAKETVREKRFRCKYCKLSYVSATRLKSHIDKHGADGRLIHKCPVCARYFATEETARQHALEQHRKRLVCELCRQEFRDPDALQQHVRYAHRGLKELRKRRYMCHRCGKYFITRSTMSDHERANCGQTPVYRCETCGKHYASFGSLKVHQTMHQNLLPYECEHCQKRFRVKSQLKVHKRSHTGEKPFRCEQCPKSFPYRESLLVHQVSHTGVKRFACSGCAQTFTCISNLQAHRRYHRATCGAVPNNTKPLKHKK